MKKLATKNNIVLDTGVPPHEFYPAAWGDEPLTSANVLTETDIFLALPHAVPERSLVAKLDDKVIGQCSLNDTVAYWEHVNQVDTANCNCSTKTFVKLHQFAAEAEMQYLDSLNEEVKDSEHNAGIAVLPAFRGQGYGKLMLEKQIVQSAERGKTTLFVETTNIYSASIMTQLLFTPVAKFAYKDLAKDLGNADLNKLDDSFGVWCKRLNRK